MLCLLCNGIRNFKRIAGFELILASHKALIKSQTIDKEEFNFNMAEINWSKLAFNCHLGIRRHLLRENDDSIPAARSRMQK